MRFLIKIAETSVHWRLIKQTDILLSTTETEYIVISETIKNVIIICRILHELSIILEDFVFSLLINNTDVIAVSESKKVVRNAKHINICYHYIWNLIEKKIIEIFHILTDEITVNDITKMLLSSKFKEFIELIRVLKIEVSDNSKISNSKFNNDKTSNNDKNDENFMTNYYKKTDKEADKKVSFKTEKTK